MLHRSASTAQRCVLYDPPRSTRQCFQIAQLLAARHSPFIRTYSYNSFVLSPETVLGARYSSEEVSSDLESQIEQPQGNVRKSRKPTLPQTTASSRTKQWASKATAYATEAVEKESTGDTRTRNIISTNENGSELPAFIRKVVAASISPAESKSQEYAASTNHVGFNESALMQWRHLYRRLSFPEDGDLKKARENLREQRRLAGTFIGSGDVTEIGHRWTQIKDLEDTPIPSILVGCLAESAKWTLIALNCMGYIPGGFRTRAECLHYLQRVYHEDLNTTPELQGMFDQQLSRLRNSKHWPRTNLQPVHFDLLLKSLSRDEAISLTRKYLEIYPYANTSCLLYIVDCFTRAGDTEGALSVLRRIPRTEIEQAGEALIGRCIKLLRLDTVEHTQQGQNFKILPALLEIGIRPNDVIHNIVIQNALKDKLPSVAWDLYHYMQRENLTVDAGTHLHLLKESFLGQNINGLNEIMSAIHQRDDLAQNPYLVAYTMNIVRVSCFFDRKVNAQESLSHLLAVYDRAYDRAPLLKLGILRERNNSLRKSTLPQPGPAGLAFTIWSYVLVQRTERRVTRLWQQLVQMIAAKDSQICGAAKHDVFYSGFIIFYCRHQLYIAKGLQLLQYMLELGLCTPRASTWDMLLRSLLKHGHRSSAEYVRQMMEARGIEVSPEASRAFLEKNTYLDGADNFQDLLDARHMPKELNETMDQGPGECGNVNHST